MSFTEFIKPELLVLIPVLLIAGKMLKEAKKVKDNYIPILLGGISVLLCGLWTFAATAYRIQNVADGLFVSVVQGILIAGTAVYGNQIYKQLKKLKEDEDNE